MMRFSTLSRIFVLLIATVGLLTACGGDRPAPPLKSIPEQQYILGPGDTLRIITYGFEDISGEFKVDSTGMVALPLIKEIKAAGLTTRKLELAITDALQPEYLKDPKVSVEVINYRDIYILGEVRTPGKYPYIPNMTALQAVAVAGGYTYRATENSVEITRLNNGQMRVFTAGVKSIINPGDTIEVKRRWF